MGLNSTDDLLMCIFCGWVLQITVALVDSELVLPTSPRRRPHHEKRREARGGSGEPRRSPREAQERPGQARTGHTFMRFEEAWAHHTFMRWPHARAWEAQEKPGEPRRGPGEARGGSGEPRRSPREAQDRPGQATHS